MLYLFGVIEITRGSTTTILRNVIVRSDAIKVLYYYYRFNNIILTQKQNIHTYIKEKKITKIITTHLVSKKKMTDDRWTVSDQRWCLRFEHAERCVLCAEDATTIECVSSALPPQLGNARVVTAVYRHGPANSTHAPLLFMTQRLHRIEPRWIKC